jgi:hypothetical protein
MMSVGQTRSKSISPRLEYKTTGHISHAANKEDAMTRQSKALIAALAALTIASPAFAQSQDRTGSMLPHYFNSLGEMVWGSWAPPTAATANQQSAQARAIVSLQAARPAKRLNTGVSNGAGAFAAAPPAVLPNPKNYTPALTGGGSAGYNENLKNY